MEGLAPPLIAAPNPWAGQEIKLWVPNNDLDAKGGDPTELASIRTAKRVRPRIFDASVPLLYAWLFSEPGDEGYAVRICDAARELYQLGRGIDMAAASGAIVDAATLARVLRQHVGPIHHPCAGEPLRGRNLGCPQRGSLASLILRYERTLTRFQTVGSGRNAIAVFEQPPKPRFAQVGYDLPGVRRLFDIRGVARLASFSPTELGRVAVLTEAVRDAAAERLASALPGLASSIERGLVGRPVEGAKPVAPEHRVRIVPLPSIGHAHADRGIRRVLVEVPSENPLRAEDVLWAFSGLRVRTDEADVVLTPSEDLGMLAYYGGGSTATGFVRYQTVTAAVLPVARRRIVPAQKSQQPKTAQERGDEEARAVYAVIQALRHAGVRTPTTNIHVQREPYSAHGARAEAFAADTRFEKERLWHVDITFRDPVAGPVVIGDGRFLGLGVMAGHDELPLAWVFAVRSGLTDRASSLTLADSLRRAVIARFQHEIGDGQRLPEFVSGHGSDGGPSRSDRRLCFAYDPQLKRLLVIPPHAVMQRRPFQEEREHLYVLARALAGLSMLRAGPAGELVLDPQPLQGNDLLFAPSRRWVSRTPYCVNRHLDRESARAAVAADLESSLRAAGLPRARIRVDDAKGQSELGLTGWADLEFEVAVPGPLLLGRTRHRGGGLFGHASDSGVGSPAAASDG